MLRMHRQRTKSRLPSRVFEKPCNEPSCLIPGQMRSLSTQYLRGRILKQGPRLRQDRHPSWRHRYQEIREPTTIAHLIGTAEDPASANPRLRQQPHSTGDSKSKPANVVENMQPSSAQAETSKVARMALESLSGRGEGESENDAHLSTKEGDAAVPNHLDGKGRSPAQHENTDPLIFVPAQDGTDYPIASMHSLSGNPHITENSRTDRPTHQGPRPHVGTMSIGLSSDSGEDNSDDDMYLSAKESGVAIQDSPRYESSAPSTSVAQQLFGIILAETATSDSTKAIPSCARRLLLTEHRKTGRIVRQRLLDRRVKSHRDAFRQGCHFLCRRLEEVRSVGKSYMTRTSSCARGRSPTKRQGEG